MASPDVETSPRLPNKKVVTFDKSTFASGSTSGSAAKNRHKFHKLKMSGAKSSASGDEDAHPGGNTGNRNNRRTFRKRSYSFTEGGGISNSKRWKYHKLIESVKNNTARHKTNANYGIFLVF